MCLLYVRHRAPLNRASPAGGAPRERAQNTGGQKRERQREKDPGACRTKTVVGGADSRRGRKGNISTELLEADGASHPHQTSTAQNVSKGDPLGSRGSGPRARPTTEGRGTSVSPLGDNEIHISTTALPAPFARVRSRKRIQQRARRRLVSTPVSLVLEHDVTHRPLHLRASYPISRRFSFPLALVFMQADKPRHIRHAHSFLSASAHLVQRRALIAEVDHYVHRERRLGDCDREQIVRDAASQRSRSRTRGSITAGRGRNAKTTMAHVIVRRLSGGGAKAAATVEAKTRKVRAGAKVEAKARTAGVGAGAATCASVNSHVLSKTGARAREEEDIRRRHLDPRRFVRTVAPPPLSTTSSSSYSCIHPAPPPRAVSAPRVPRDRGAAPKSPMGDALQDGINLETLGTKETAAARYRTGMRLRRRRIQYQRSVFDHPGERKRNEEIAAALRSAKDSARKRREANKKQLKRVKMTHLSANPQSIIHIARSSPPNLSAAEPRLRPRPRPLYIFVREVGERSTEAMVSLVIVVFVPATSIFFLAPSPLPAFQHPHPPHDVLERGQQDGGEAPLPWSCSIAGRPASRAAQEEEWDAEVEVDVAEEADVAEEVEAAEVDVAAAREQRNDEEQGAKLPKERSSGKGNAKKREEKSGSLVPRTYAILSAIALTRILPSANVIRRADRGVKDVLLSVVAVFHANYRTKVAVTGKAIAAVPYPLYNRGGEQRDSARRYARAKCLRCWWESSRREAVRISGEEDVEEEEAVEEGYNDKLTGRLCLTLRELRSSLRLRLLPIDRATARSETVAEWYNLEKQSFRDLMANAPERSRSYSSKLSLQRWLHDPSLPSKFVDRAFFSNAESALWQHFSSLLEISDDVDSWSVVREVIATSKAVCRRRERLEEGKAVSAAGLSERQRSAGKAGAGRGGALMHNQPVRKGTRGLETRPEAAQKERSYRELEARARARREADGPEGPKRKQAQRGEENISNC
ncbi:hypothetical protein C8R45DRAFT_942709 [Mycena sanguinolenta]|nr:hypothetical protein C8R45DRAFT_942709 [Mycena sanguinolenta]